MIRKLHVQNFRLLRSESIELSHFRVIAGPAASGKSTLLQALRLLSSVVSRGAEQALREIAPSFADLCFDPTRPIAVALELIPSHDDQPNVRYELELAATASGRAPVRIAREQLFVLRSESLFSEPPPAQPSLFEAERGSSIVHDRTPRGWRKVVAKSAEGRDTFWDERTDWHSMLRFGADRSALGSLPEDPERFPIALAVRDFLRDSIRTLALEPSKLRAPAAPGTVPRLAVDGSNLPFAVQDLRRRNPEGYERWLSQAKVAVPGLKELAIRERDSDRFLVLEAAFEGMHTQAVPSWCLSDSLLRVLALSLIPHHLSGGEEVYLLDEIEAGLHPRGMHVVFEALSHLPPQTQLLCATNSPLLAGRANPKDVLVFRRGAEGQTLVRSGEELPDRVSWFEP